MKKPHNYQEAVRMKAAEKELRAARQQLAGYATDVEALHTKVKKLTSLRDAARTRARNLDDRIKKIHAGLYKILHGGCKIDELDRHELAVLLDLTIGGKS